jgi:hypothetical protein
MSPGTEIRHRCSLQIPGYMSGACRRRCGTLPQAMYQRNRRLLRQIPQSERVDRSCTVGGREGCIRHKRSRCDKPPRAALARDCVRTLDDLVWPADTSRPDRERVPGRWHVHSHETGTASSLRCRVGSWGGHSEASQARGPKDAYYWSTSKLRSELHEAKERFRHKKDIAGGYDRQPGFGVLLVNAEIDNPEFAAQRTGGRSRLVCVRECYGAALF